MNYKPFEENLRSEGYHRIAGLDEAGRGPLAGAVVAAAVVLGDEIPEGLQDSKTLTPEKRERVYEKLANGDADYGVGVVDQFQIDKLNILQATVLAMKKAVGAIQDPPDYLLVDGSYLPEFIYPADCIPKGDACCRSIAAASIIAKVVRDRFMIQLDAFFPGYGFARHKGYPTQEHMESIVAYGPTPLHRLTFGGVREHLPRLRTERKALGKWGEDYTCYYLWKKGATLLSRNFRASRDAELDIVVLLNGTVRFIEVKTGSGTEFSRPEEWVDDGKTARIYEASEAFLHAHEEYQEYPCQFDIAAVEVQNTETQVRYLENAFR